MMEQEFKCQTRVEFMGEVLHMNQIIARIDLEEIMPPRHLIRGDPFDLVRVHEAGERRRRLIDMIAAEFAHSLTEALFKKARA